MPPDRFSPRRGPVLQALGRQGAVVTIGNYDGIHLGHQVVLHAQRRVAARLSLPTVALVFEPQPREYFDPQSAPPRLTRLREKYLLLRDYGIDHFVCLRFGAWLATLTAEDFVDRVLIERLGARGLVVGDDFRFGQGRRGDYALLCALGRARGVEVLRVPAFERDGERVSSTRVREALARGDLSAASRLLGRPYAIFGRVVHGEKRGRTWGYATANIPLRRRSSAVRGIFVARVRGVGTRPLPAVAYVGPCPALAGTHELLEVHVLDFDADLYGEALWVEFLHLLREDRTFDTLEALRAQIALDVEDARRLWAQGTGTDAIEGLWTEGSGSSSPTAGDHALGGRAA
ncbi:MAG: bifunctional riboflavin kinase/FAD synthetase [Actinobacteria bacterium]|nr:bifunctional riboflavin kinase/FAD synthetase [Actinomycetota bacterium]